MKYKVGFIGCGNMGGALLRIAVKNLGAESCCVSEKEPKKAEPFTSLGVTLLPARELCLKSDCVFLAVKPQAMQELVSDLSETLDSGHTPLFVTMAAGLEIATIEKFLRRKAPVIRIMPNIPCSLGRGVLLFCQNSLVSGEQREAFLSSLEGVGLIDEIAEEKIDAASIVSGCGPAFVYMFASSLASGAEKCGLDKKSAVCYAINTLYGAAAVMESSDAEIDELVRAVCSPKGSTIEGVEALKKDGFAEIVEKAVMASYKRTQELKNS